MERVVSAFGLLVMIGLAWLLSSRRQAIVWRTVFAGLVLQFVFAALVLRTSAGQAIFDQLGQTFLSLLQFVDAGSSFVFGTEGEDGSRDLKLLTAFAFGTLPTIIFISSLMAILYYLGIMQRVVRAFAFLMRKSLRLSGAESLSVAANIFLGQVEAPLVVRPYLASMTRSELMAVMLAGFATIAGGVMAAYVKMGIDAGHLVAASVISAPAAIAIAKILEPETEEPVTRSGRLVEVQESSVNVFDAAASGALLGLQLALQVAAIIIAFLALIAMTKFLVDGALSLAGSSWTLEDLLGWAFAPLAWCMGIEAADCRMAGELLGVRMVSNEFIAYARLSEMIRDPSSMAPRTQILLTYALCGFANFGSIGVQLGGIGAAAPTRQSDLARLGFRAMLGGMLACFMTACVAGVLL